MSKIQNLNGTHNNLHSFAEGECVVYDVKDTKSDYRVQITDYKVQSTELYHTLK